MIALGLASQDVKLIGIVGTIYFIGCYTLGFCLYKFGWIEAEAEIGNRYNPFQKELRKHIKKKKI